MKNSKQKKSKGFGKFLLSLYSPVKGLFCLMIFLMILAQILSLIGMYTIKNTVNLPFKENFELKQLYIALAIIAVVFVVETIARYISMTIRSIPLRVKQGKFVTQKLFNHLSNKSYSYYSDNYSGKIANAISEVCPKLERLNKVILQDLICHIGSMITSFVILASINLVIFGISFVIYIGIIVGRLVYFKITYLKCQKSAQIENREFNGLLNDSIMNFTSLRIYNSVNAFSNNIVGQKSRELFYKSKASKHEFLYGFFSNILHLVVLISIAVYGLELYKLSAITIGDFVFILTSMISIKNSTTSISWQIVDISDTLVVINNSYELLYDDNNIFEDNKPDLQINSGTVEFKDVSFKYTNEDVFNHFSLKVEDKTKVGIIGVSGSGKSTLVNLLFKFYKCNSGSILIDGKNIDDFSNKSLYNNITYVPQDTILLHSTIYENIRLAKPSATEEEIFEASKKAELHEFIESLPNKYETIVGERGIKLSGGQRQRITLARIFLKSTKIVIFDEATSALDNETEFKIQKNINQYLKGQTIICIAHRLSTLTDMDKILVIEKGKIIDSGTPKKIIPKYSKTNYFDQTN